MEEEEGGGGARRGSAGSGGSRRRRRCWHRTMGGGKKGERGKGGGDGVARDGIEQRGNIRGEREEQGRKKGKRRQRWWSTAATSTREGETEADGEPWTQGSRRSRATAKTAAATGRAKKWGGKKEKRGTETTVVTSAERGIDAEEVDGGAELPWPKGKKKQLRWRSVLATGRRNREEAEEWGDGVAVNRGS